MPLSYRPDWDYARDRLTTWWNGGDIGRAVMQLTAPREEPWEHLPEVPRPEGWLTGYSTIDLEYHLYARYRSVGRRTYLGEAPPVIAPGDVGPGAVGART